MKTVNSKHYTPSSDEQFKISGQCFASHAKMSMHFYSLQQCKICDSYSGVIEDATSVVCTFVSQGE